MPDQNYNRGDGPTPVDHDTPKTKRKLTEAEAVLTLVRGGWLKFEMVDPR